MTNFVKIKNMNVEALAEFIQNCENAPCNCCLIKTVLTGKNVKET